MHNQLLIHAIGDPRHETDSQIPDRLRLQRREGAEDLRRTVRTQSVHALTHSFFDSSRRKQAQAGSGVNFNEPRTAENRIAHHNQLSDDAQNIQMRPMREQKIPQPEHLGQGRGASAEGQDGGEGVELGVHALGEEVVGELVVNDGEAPVDEAEPPVHAVHGAAHVAGAFARQEAVEGDEGFGFAPRGIQEGRAEHVHPLHVDAWFRDAGVGAFGRGGGWSGLFGDGRDGVELG